MAVEEVDLAGLERVVSREPLVLVDFWGPMCAPCRVLKPHLARLADEHAGRVSVVAINAERETDAAERFAVRGIPTLVLFREGAEATRLTGSVLPSQVARLLAEAT